jgi:outer membrane protein assembly factor BamD
MPVSLPSSSFTLRAAPLRGLVLVLALALIGSGCARIKGVFKDEDANEGVPVAELYEKGQRSLRNGNYDGALQAYKRLIAQYPYGPYTEQALIETAYAEYKMGQNEDAISSIDRFLRTYPTHRSSAYMYYLRGLVNSSRDTVFLQRVWRLDPSRRDLSTPQQAYNDFQIVVERFPNSRYAADARQRMQGLNVRALRNRDRAVLPPPRRRGRRAGTRQVRARHLSEKQVPQRRRRRDGRGLHPARQHRAGRQRPQPAAAVRPAAPVAGRRMAGLPVQLPQTQPFRAREVGAG